MEKGQKAGVFQRATLRIHEPNQSPSVPLPKPMGSSAVRPTMRFPRQGAGAVPIMGQEAVVDTIKKLPGSKGFSKGPAPKVETGEGPSFGLKTALTLEEAQELVILVKEATQPINKAIDEKDLTECVRNLEAGPYPLVLKVLDRLEHDIANSVQVHELTNGEITVLEKAIACSQQLAAKGMLETTIALTASGVGILAFILAV